MNLMLTLAAQVFVTAGFFCSTVIFYREKNDGHRQNTDHFFADLETPVIADAEQDGYDRQQRQKLGSMVMYMGTGLLFMMLIPNPGWGRLMFGLCAIAILTIGWLLKRGARDHGAALSH